ncbi:9688_t:CDS:1 [Funneliformis caledonium]|uniref:9688_t:CDS:1 n=1 Tax=Funneliformis caledonium TaxID=1117310 RepID=A0A9N9EKU0_9GLOM|nr:9688_t:CDS:1 [Funneliformis caledonium]
MPSRKLSSSQNKTSANKQTSVKKSSNKSKKSAAHTKSSTAPKVKNVWRSEEDKILVDKILEDMPSPSWSKISHCLKDRNPNACLVRWKTLKKRLYQSSQ